MDAAYMDSIYIFMIMHEYYIIFFFKSVFNGKGLLETEM